MKTAAETLSELLAMNLSKEDSILLAFSQGVIAGWQKHASLDPERGLAESQGEPHVGV